VRPDPRPLTIALLGIVLLSGCILWPPFGLPGSDQAMIVENRSDDELIVRVTDSQGFPLSFAVPAGTVGEALVFTMADPASVELLDRDCEVLAEMTVERLPEHLLVEADHAITTSDAPPEAGRQLVEIFECDVPGAAPVVDEEALAVGAAGRMVVSGGFDGDLWGLTLPDGDLEPLTSGAGSDAMGDVAADGSVVFTRFDTMEVTGSVWLLDADADEPRRLRDHGSAAMWSPDGSRVAVIDDDPFGGGVIVVDRDGDGAVDVTEEVVTGMAWSPDGDRLAFLASDASSDPYDPAGEARLMVAVPGEPPTELARVSGFGSVAWSPDGSRLAVETLAGMGSGVSVIDAASGDELFVIDAGSAFTAAPHWSPDGERLAFLRSDGFDLSTTVMSVDADGGDPIELGDLDQLAVSAPLVWSPDGDFLAVAGSGMTVAGELWLVPAAGGDPARLVTGVTAILGWH
jgi:Tol biopolymer transport system component